jgi:hypothetical protein
MESETLNKAEGLLRAGIHVRKTKIHDTAKVGCVSRQCSIQRLDVVPELKVPTEPKPCYWNKS